MGGPINFPVRPLFFAYYYKILVKKFVRFKNFSQFCFRTFGKFSPAMESSKDFTELSSHFYFGWKHIRRM